MAVLVQNGEPERAIQIVIDALRDCKVCHQNRLVEVKVTAPDDIVDGEDAATLCIAD